jgi:hypothetical protein
MTFCPPPYSPDLARYYILLSPWFKIKLKGCHFDTTEVTEAESQVVLHILTEHEIQMYLKKMADAL